MIAHIDMLLCRWGRWALANARREVGYASVSPMFKDAGSGAYGSGIPPGVSVISDDMQAVDLAVQALPAVQRCVVIHHYQLQSSLRNTATVCGISYKSVSQYLGQAHELLSERLE